MINKSGLHYEQALLLASVLPWVAEEECFALKGGTAINLFVRDMPRLSVDIDLTFVPLTNRDDALNLIGQALKRIGSRVESRIPEAQCVLLGPESAQPSKALVRRGKVQIKIEPNLVIRGTVMGVANMPLRPAASDFFEREITMQVTSVPDLYGGKICAALDRQHPRDLFDIALLFQVDGITDPIRHAFIAYLLSHDRPMAELLDPVWRPIEAAYENELVGMMADPISLEDLARIPEKLSTQIRRDLRDNEREFLLSFKSGTPRWEILGIAGIENLPAIQWKLQNIQRLMQNKGKHQTALKKLESILAK